jgi:hypothetical protein
MKLKKDKPDDWPLVSEAIVLCVLGQARTCPEPYDRKFLELEQKGDDGFLFVPIFPAVLAAYRNFFWDQVMANVEKLESLYLSVCRSPETTNDTRGRLFEAIAIQRIKSRGLKVSGTWGCTKVHEVKVERGNIQHFSGSKLPHHSQVMENTLYIPDSSNFPAIDFFFRTKSTLVAFQVHVSKHKDVSSKLSGMCRNAGWFENFNTVVLIYLSPDEASEEFGRRLVRPGETVSPNTRSSQGGTVHLSAMTCAHFPYTLDIVWQ